MTLRWRLTAIILLLTTKKNRTILLKNKLGVPDAFKKSQGHAQFKNENIFIS